MNIIQPQKRKAILTLATTWMNLEHTTLRQATQKDDYCVIPLDEALEQSLSRRQKGWGKGIQCNCWEVQSLEMGADSDCTTVCEYLTPQNCPLRVRLKQSFLYFG